MAKDREQLLAELREKKANCKLARAQKALKAWSFEKRPRRKQNVEVWTYRHITLTLHAPHPPKGPMKPGAVTQVIKMIEEAKLLQDDEEESRNVN